LEHKKWKSLNFITHYSYFIESSFIISFAHCAAQKRSKYIIILYVLFISFETWYVETCCTYLRHHFRFFFRRCELLSGQILNFIRLFKKIKMFFLFKIVFLFYYRVSTPKDFKNCESHIIYNIKTLIKANA